MPTVEVNGTKLEFTEQGSGEPVVFVHGSVSDYRTWSAQLTPFTQTYHVITYSRRYHYPNISSGVGSDYTVETHSRDLVALIQKLGLQHVCLVGASYGAYTSLLTGIRHADLIRALVLGEPPVLPLLADPDNLRQILWLALRSPATALPFIRFGAKAIKPAREAFRRGNLENGVKSFVNGVLGGNSFDRLPAIARGVFLDNANALKAELLGPGFPPFPVVEARNCKIPTLLVYGDKSPRFFHAILNRLSSILANTKRVHISDASHGMHRDNPEEYNSKVLNFLSQLS